MEVGDGVKLSHFLFFFFFLEIIRDVGGFWWDERSVVVFVLRLVTQRFFDLYSLTLPRARFNLVVGRCSYIYLYIYIYNYIYLIYIYIDSCL